MTALSALLREFIATSECHIAALSISIPQKYESPPRYHSLDARGVTMAATVDSLAILGNTSHIMLLEWQRNTHKLTLHVLANIICNITDTTPAEKDEIVACVIGVQQKHGSNYDVDLACKSILETHTTQVSSGG